MSKSWLLQLSLSIWDLSLGLRWDNQSEVHSTKTQPTRNSLKLTLETSWDHNQLTNCQVVKISSYLFSEVIISTYFDLILTLFWPFQTYSEVRTLWLDQLCGAGGSLSHWVVEHVVQLVEHTRIHKKTTIRRDKIWPSLVERLLKPQLNQEVQIHHFFAHLYSLFVLFISFAVFFFLWKLTQISQVSVAAAQAAIIPRSKKIRKNHSMV